MFIQLIILYVPEERHLLLTVSFLGVGLRPLVCWDRGFESQWGHGCLSVVSVVCCPVVVSATDWSLVQGSPTDRGTSLCVIKKPRTRGGYSPARWLQNTNPEWVVAPVEEKKSVLCIIQLSRQTEPYSIRKWRYNARGFGQLSETPLFALQGMIGL